MRLRMTLTLFCCGTALMSTPVAAAEFDSCKSGDEPGVICAYGLGDWGCNGPCEGGGKYGPMTIYKPPTGYQVCKALMTRRDIKGGECTFTGGPNELQLACSAPKPATHARVNEVTVYSIANNANPARFTKYECIKW